MSEFEAIVSNMDAVDVVEEALENLEGVFEDEGLVHILEAEKCLSVMKGLSRGQIVNTLEALLSDTDLLEGTLLKIHYIYHLAKSAHEKKINLTALVTVLKDISVESIKFLTPDDISYIYSTITPSKIASGAQAAARQIDHIKSVKEQLIQKTNDLVNYDSGLRAELENGNQARNQYKMNMLEAVKDRFISIDYSLSKSTSQDSAPVTPTGGSSGGNEKSKNTSARLDSQLNKMMKEKPNASGSKTRHDKRDTNLTMALLNKVAEEHLKQLEFDEAYDALLAEVSKLEKKFVAQKASKGEISLKKRMNELLLQQIELAEEKRVLHEQTVKSVMDHTHAAQEDYNQQRLERALAQASMTEMRTNSELKSSQEQFDISLVETDEYFNNLLLDINAKRIVEMQKANSKRNKKLEQETRDLVRDKTQFLGMLNMQRNISDELFHQLQEDAKLMGKKFEKVYNTAKEVIDENRNADEGDKVRMRNKRSPFQTELVDMYTNIHSMQRNFTENPTLDFELELSKICEDLDANAVKVLSKSDNMYDDCQGTYVDVVLNRYDAAKYVQKRK